MRRKQVFLPTFLSSLSPLARKKITQGNSQVSRRWWCVRRGNIAASAWPMWAQLHDRSDASQKIKRYIFCRTMKRRKKEKIEQRGEVFSNQVQARCDRQRRERERKKCENSLWKCFSPWLGSSRIMITAIRDSRQPEFFTFFFPVAVNCCNIVSTVSTSSVDEDDKDRGFEPIQVACKLFITSSHAAWTRT